MKSRLVVGKKLAKSWALEGRIWAVWLSGKYSSCSSRSSIGSNMSSGSAKSSSADAIVEVYVSADDLGAMGLLRGANSAS